MRRPKQGELPFHRGTWGGRRPGAGRPAGKNPRVRHLSRRKFPGSHPCHVTLKVREGIASLRTVSVVKEVEATFRRCERAGFRLVHYSIQGNHLHAIVEAHGREALGRGMMAIGIRFARAVNRALKRSGPVLKDRYHFRPLRTPTEVRNALRYVLLNARRHAAERGAHLRERVRLDPASSARWFDGWKRGTVGEEASRSADLPAVRLPRTWLLGVGWRRLGLLDPAEIPGSA